MAKYSLRNFVVSKSCIISNSCYSFDLYQNELRLSQCVINYSINHSKTVEYALYN